MNAKKQAGQAAPLRYIRAVTEADKRFSYEEAVALTFEAFERFDQVFASKARRVFAEKHVDSEVRKGKMGGAFCSTILPELTPWVLLNYQGKSDDVSTMAHELGHAVHSMMPRSTRSTPSTPACRWRKPLPHSAK